MKVFDQLVDCLIVILLYFVSKENLANIESFIVAIDVDNVEQGHIELVCLIS